MKIFNTIYLSDGRQCDILNITFGMISRANFQHSMSLDGYDPAIFVVQQSIRINNKECTIEELSNLSFDDYIEIMHIMNAVMLKIPR